MSARIETVRIDGWWYVEVDGYVDGDTGGHQDEAAAVSAFNAEYQTDHVVTSANRAVVALATGSQS